MNRVMVVSCVVALLALGAGCEKKDGGETGEQTFPAAGEGLKTPKEFASIDDEAERSRAIFEEMGKVLQHPRCVNCHPAGERALQGDQSRPHQPLVTRGAGGMGVAGMRCNSCHGDKNFRNVPGHPVWRLAPASMGWADKSLAEICRSLKGGDQPGQEGSKSLEGLAEKISENSLIGWGWQPPEHLEAAPGSQKLLGALTQAWVETGAKCPTPGAGE